MCGYLLIKISFVSSNGLLKFKKKIGPLTRTSQNRKLDIDSNFKFVIGIQYII
jgi:hypothetical protein